MKLDSQCGGYSPSRPNLVYWGPNPGRITKELANVLIARASTNLTLVPAMTTVTQATFVC